MDRRDFMRSMSTGAAALALAGLSSCSSWKGTKPNILLILADDMGYSDAGCFGGEIDTPHIDRIASRGLSYTHFYNTGRCCPTRASLLTGLYAHQTGMGWMTAADLGHPGYTGDLNRRCATIAELLVHSGYGTYMSGKWHLNADHTLKPEGPRYNWPLQRGFQRYFGPLNGGGSYFSTRTLTADNTQIVPPPDFYLTDAIADEARSFLFQHQQNRPEDPFFLYVAFTAPHFPLHAKRADVEKYRGRYRQGWDQLREQRYDNLLKLGIIDREWGLSRRDADIRAWRDLSPAEQDEMDSRMAIYAAQVDCMDQGIGRILRSLEELGRLEDTLILFLSDNGGTHELISRGETGIEALGTDLSFESYRKSWANLSNTPFRLYKHWVHEGGISTPLIVHWPAGITGTREFRRQTGHVVDILPTLLDLAGVAYPDQLDGQPLLPLEGKSLVPTFSDRPIGEERFLFWEHEANRAIRDGNWKAVSGGLDQPWELYNLETDRTELSDLATEEPTRLESMAREWQAWAQRCEVLPLDGRGWNERLAG